MKILGIESSCDETSVAVVENGTRLLSNVIATSQELHAKYGGIIPDRAAREQLKSILPVLNEALLKSDKSWSDIDALAVTQGPGLIGSLLVGVETAKALAFSLNKPLIPVNHLIGHIYANWLDVPSPALPALVLLVSGGHTELILMENHGHFTLLGSTRDDAAGECFDKCGRLLGLPYPYGPLLGPLAAKFSPPPTYHSFLPRPLKGQPGLDFSFSGLKTALSISLTKHPPEELAYELQEAITDVLVSKTLAALRLHPVPSLLLCGGVAANLRLREKMSLEIKNCKLKINVCVPPINLCTDNAAYIAGAAFFNQNFVAWKELNADPSLNFTPPR